MQDVRIRSITPRCNWALHEVNNHSIQSVKNNEILYSAGNRLCLYDDNLQQTMYLGSGISVIHSFVVSSDNKYVAVSASLVGAQNKNNITILVYDLMASNSSFTKSSKITHTCEGIEHASRECKATCIAFSTDSALLAFSTNHIEIGVLIYDRVLESKIHQISTDKSLIMELSFHPKDSSRIVTIGTKNHFHFWRCTSKTTFSSTINGIHHNNHQIKGIVTFNCHHWISDSHIVVGSNSGFIALIQGSDLQHKIQYPFGSPDQTNKCDVPVCYLSSRDDIVIVGSSQNHFALYEVKKVGASGSHGVSAMLVHLVRIKINEINNILGIQWRLKSNAAIFEAYVPCKHSLYLIDFRGNDYRSVMGNETTDNKTLHNIESVCEWTTLRPTKTIRTFHCGSVNNLSIAQRKSQFATYSNDDKMLHIWDCNRSVSVTSHNFKNERLDLIPTYIDLHPTGNTILIASDENVRECIISENKIDELKVIPTKTAFTTSNGTPYVNNLPVTLAKYSNGGNLIAIVTGKFAQIYNMLQLDYDVLDSNGTPRRVMVLGDHTSNITDLCFSSDDQFIFTTSNDGYVFSWKLYDSVRNSEYFVKGIPAQSICISPLQDSKRNIVAYYESIDVNIHRKQQPGKRGRLHSILPGSSQKESSTISNDPDITSAVARALESQKQIYTNEEVKSVDTEQVASNELSVKSKHFLVVWQGNLSINGKVICLEAPISSISLGLSESGPDRSEICMIGYTDGRILISILPFPLKVVSNNLLNTRHDYLNETLCKILPLHSSNIISTKISPSGAWLISCSQDGSIYLMSTSNRVKEIGDIAEYNNILDNHYFSMQKEYLLELRHKVDGFDHKLDDVNREHDRSISKANKISLNTINELEAKMVREVKKRDEIILRLREDYIKDTKKLREDLVQQETKYKREISELEVYYERKLTQESLYVEKMRQAYEEFVLNSKMDFVDFQRKSELKESKMLNEKTSILSDAEKQKGAILQYVEYVNNRHSEILRELEAAQVIEREKLKEELDQAASIADSLQRNNREEIAKYSRQIHNLNINVAANENEIMRLKSDLDWANNRIQKLELTLQQVTNDLKLRTEAFDKSEFKIGEQQQYIHELERIRKALTTQLHTLRQELNPKEEKLMQVSEKVYEMDREYENLLHSISQKEAKITQQTSHLHLLQKQVRELRHIAARKDGALKRASKLLDEYEFSLQEARFNSYKKTIVIDGEEKEMKKKRNELVEIIAKNENMEVSLKRLHDILHPYSKNDGSDYDIEKESADATIERERHMQLLHKNIDGLKSNLDLTTTVSTMKMTNQIHDNTTLLQEVNSMRHEIRTLFMENQRLNAKIKLMNIKKKDKNEDDIKDNISNYPTPKEIISPTNISTKTLNAYIDYVGNSSHASFSDSRSLYDGDINDEIPSTPLTNNAYNAIESGIEHLVGNNDSSAEEKISQLFAMNMNIIEQDHERKQNSASLNVERANSTNSRNSSLKLSESNETLQFYQQKHKEIISKTATNNIINNDSNVKRNKKNFPNKAVKKELAGKTFLPSLDLK